MEAEKKLKEPRQKQISVIEKSAFPSNKEDENKGDEKGASRFAEMTKEKCRGFLHEDVPGGLDLEGLDLEKEWKFITEETHRERATPNNLEKRGLLFDMQILLMNGKTDIYPLARALYLKM